MERETGMADAPANIEDATWCSRHLWQIKPLQDVFWIGLGLALVWFGYHLRSVFVPILIGLGLAYAVNPLLSFAERRWKLPRPVTIGVIFFGISTITIATLVSLTPVLMDEVKTLSTKAPAYVNTLATRLNAKVDDDLVGDLNQLTAKLPANSIQLAKFALTNTGTAMGVVSDVVSTTAYAIAALCLIPIYFFFFAWHFNPMLLRIRELIPHAHRDRFLMIAGRMDDAVGNFLRGRMVVVLAMIVMFSAGFWLAAVPYWFLLGSVTGLLSFVPYLAVIGCLLAISVKWIDVTTSSSGSFDWISVFAWPAGAYGVVQLLEGWLLTPWIQSKSMEINAIGILIVLLIAGAVGGLYGVLLAIPAAGCARILSESLLIPKLEAWAEDT